jgi:hypothetical protein
MTAEPKKPRKRKKPQLQTETGRAPGDFATKAFEVVATHIREKLALEANGDDRDRWKYVFVHNVLLELAAGRDPRKLIDRRKSVNGPSAQAVKAVFDAMHDGACRSMEDAYAIAAAALGNIDERNVKRYWSEHQAATGVRCIPPWVTLSRLSNFVAQQPGRRDRKGAKAQG